MYARVWRFGILPGRADEFIAILKAAVPAWRKMSGFRSLVVMRTGPGDMLDGTVVSMWDSLDDLRASENSTFRAIVVRLLSCCEPHPVMREEEVLISEFASAEESGITAIG